MISELILKNKLLDCLKNEQVAFQYYDGLVDFTFDNEADKTLNLMKYIESANLRIIEHSVKKCDGFDSLLDWSIDSDFLIKVNEDLIICISGNSKNFQID